MPRPKASQFKDKEFRTPLMCNDPNWQTWDCVAIAINKNGVAVRWTHDKTKTTVTFTKSEWRNFIKAVRHGAFSA